MPLNDKRIISLIHEQCAGMDERCEGYRKEITDVITDILRYERSHRVSRTDIQQKINERCSVAARLLAGKREQDVGSSELNS